MSSDLVAVHLRRARNWALIAALFGTMVPIGEYAAHAAIWVVAVTACGALFAWRSVVVQIRSLRIVSTIAPANER